MTDTTILDGLMATLRRNPLTPERLGHMGLQGQFRPTEEPAFYARREVVTPSEANPNFSEVADLFHQDKSAVRMERPRKGSCPSMVREERTIDGQTWVREEGCGGIVHAVETVIQGAVRVDGKCLKCGAEIHRAGLLQEKGK